MKKLLSLITMFALILSLSTNLCVFAGSEHSENVASMNEVQTGRNKENKDLNFKVAIAALVTITSTVAIAGTACYYGFENGKKDWTDWNAIKSGISSGWDKLFGCKVTSESQPVDEMLHENMTAYDTFNSTNGTIHGDTLGGNYTFNSTNSTKG